MMKILEINSHQLLLEKALDPLSTSDIKELQRIETLDVTGFSEADVRAEIIDPMLRILGYRKGQDYSVDREKHIRFLGKTHRYIDLRIPAKTATYSGNNFTTYTLIQFPC